VSQALNDQWIAINYYLNCKINVNLTHINTPKKKEKENVRRSCSDKKQLNTDK